MKKSILIFSIVSSISIIVVIMAFIIIGLLITNSESDPQGYTEEVIVIYFKTDTKVEDIKNITEYIDQFHPHSEIYFLGLNQTYHMIISIENEVNQKFLINTLKNNSNIDIIYIDNVDIIGMWDINEI